MLKNRIDKTIKRIIDANFNRSKEGLRVCEEITRFILNDRGLTEELKNLRHQLNTILKNIPLTGKELLKARNSLEDIGEDIFINELKRKNVNDIFFANLQRVKESVRVLEEFSKLIDRKSAISFKACRYAIYELEKKAVRKISALYNL